MTGQLNTFNRIAPLYDILKVLVFGNAIDKSQTEFIGCVPQNGNLLIIGGGSGRILSALRQLNPDCRVWYVEASSTMLSMAAKRIPPDGMAHITFIHGTETSIPPGLSFDAIITNFFLDLFPDEKLGAICRMMNSRLRPNGVWLVSDFVNGRRWWQRMLLKSMYRFFATTSGIEAGSLPSWERQVHSAGMEEADFRLFYTGFIKSAVYIKGV